ncbi:proteasome stabiliser-domain-containing protein [Peziza echinospora]|nr:proteasome stabiliser-domain-containing protein [Peziza echinospora]
MSTLTPTPPPPPDESKELALINKVELRIALTSTDTSLQTLLGTYLPALLLKLASPHLSVRNKIIALCQHVNTRIKSSESIQLPVEKLLRQFKDPEVGGRWPLVRNFDVMYIGQGVQRMKVEDRITLLPLLITNISSTPAQHQPQIFNILLDILPYYKPPPRGTSEDAALKTYFAFDTRPEDAEFLQTWFTRLMFLTYQTFNSSATSSSGSTQTCRGLTPEEYSFLTLGGKRETWNPPGRPLGEKLKMAKVAALGFLATGAFADGERYLAALVASAHSVTEDSRVVELGEEIFKRSAPGVPLDGEDGAGEKVIEKLYGLFFLGMEGRVVPPVRWSLRTKIVTILSKSRRAVSGRFGAFVPRVVKLAVGGNGGSAAAEDSVGWNDVERDIRKLRREAFVFVNWFARVGDTPTVQAHGRTIFETLRMYIAGVKEQLLSQQSQPQQQQSTGAFDDARGPAYEAMGLLCRRLFKELVYVSDLDVLRFFFSSLRETGITATAEIRQSVEAALSSLLVGFSSSGVEYDEDVEDALAEFLVQEVEGEEAEGRSGMTKYVAVRFANRGLRFDNVKAKWICLLAAGSGGTAAGNSGRSEVVEEGRRGLDPYWYRMLNPAPQILQVEATKEEKVVGDDGDGDGDGDVDMDAPTRKKSSRNRYSYPDFVELIQYITAPHFRLTEGGGRRVINNIPVEIYSLVVDFCKRILVTEALQNYSGSSSGNNNTSSTAAVVDELDSQTFSTKLDTAITADTHTRAAVADLISSYFYSDSTAPESLALHTLFTLAYDGLVKDISACAEVWVELCELAPQSLVAEWAGARDKVLDLRSMVVNGAFSTAGGGGNNDLDKRNLLVKALGSVLTHPQCDDAILEGTVASFVEMRREGGYKAYISIVGIGYLFGRLALRGRLEEALSEEVRAKCLGIITSAVLEASTISSEKILAEAGLTALSELCVFGVVSKESLTSDVRKSLMERFTKLAKSEGVEKAILAVGCYSLVFDSTSAEDVEELEAVEKLLYDLHENKKLELSFAVGEAFTIYAAGWDCRSLTRRYLDIRGATPPEKVVNRRKDGVLLKKVVDKVLDEYSRSTKPSLRRGACVWLLSLIEGCGEMEIVVRRLKDAQAAFRGFLVDRDEFVQETASRGLTLVYEKGDKEMKDELVRSLIASFTGDTKAQTLAGQVSADTQLFEPGTLQTGTSDHGSISTYKDIMSLASEVGDPSLIYRFMSLAKHNSLWASRASFGRYGLGSILSNSSSSVDGYLTENPKLYPKLYRYRFDPNPNVRKSMNDIWSAMVKDSQGTLDKYFDDILTDLLKTILDREWRVREASCGALGDLLQGREVARYAAYLERIWGVAFKVMDDIKESVRIAALTLCRVLATSMVRVVSVDSGASQKDADIVLKNLMPFLLGIQGLEAQAKEVQIFALDTLMKLIKNAGKTLKGYIPELVEKLLGLLSTLEHQGLNYLHLNAAKYNLTEEKIDAARLSGVRSSPLMDAIERCLDLLDEPTMAKLMPHLVRTIKKAVGMPSKVGSSRVIVTLVVRHHFLTKPHADDLLKAVMSVILDRNDAVSTSWAVAAGYLCRLCSDAQVLALVGLARKMWFENEEGRARALSGEIIHDISRHSTDKFNSLSSSILPFVYLAKHDLSSSSSSTSSSSTASTTIFTTTWTENTGGTGAIKLHLREIVTLAQENLLSNRWAVKQASALTLADICTSLGKDVGQDQLEIIYPAIVKATDGKSWEGKEKVLEGFVELVANFPSVEGRGGDVVVVARNRRIQEARKIVLREARRNNRPYQAKAISSLARFVEAVRGEVDMFEDVVGVVERALEQDDDEDDTPGGGGAGGGSSKDTSGGSGDADKMDITDTEGRSLRSTTLTAYLNSLKALANTFPPPSSPSTSLSKKDIQSRINKFLTLLTAPPKSLSGMALTYPSKLAQVDALSTFLKSGSGGVLVLEEEEADVVLRVWRFVVPYLQDRGSEELRLRVARGVVAGVVGAVAGMKGGEVKVREVVRGELAGLVEAERSRSVKEVLEEGVGRLRE